MCVCYVWDVFAFGCDLYGTEMVPITTYLQSLSAAAHPMRVCRTHSERLIIMMIIIIIIIIIIVIY